MTDLAVLAIGFGGIPLASILLYSLRGWIAAHREMAWGGLAGVIAFLGLSHAMALVLENKPFLFDGSSVIATTLFLLTGLTVGGATGWLLFEGRFLPSEPSRVVWAATAFLALHSFGDGLILGRDFVGVVSPVLPIDALTVSATVLHRFLEGAILLVPAFAAAWRLRSSFLALFAALLSIPAAYVPRYLVDSMGLVGGNGATLALSTFFASVEASLALLLLVRGFVPRASADRGTRWSAWIAIGFAAISVVHFLVE